MLININNYNFGLIRHLEMKLDDEWGHQENLCVYNGDAVNYFEHRTQYFYLGNGIGLNTVYNGVYRFIDSYTNHTAYLESEKAGNSGSGILPVCLELVRLLTKKIEDHIIYKLKRYIYKLDGPFRHLEIDTTQYNHSWTIVECRGERETLSLWLENASKIPNCHYLVEVFVRFIIMRVIKLQALVRMYLN